MYSFPNPLIIFEITFVRKAIHYHLLVMKGFIIVHLTEPMIENEKMFAGIDRSIF